jgi:hypothetical protein
MKCKFAVGQKVVCINDKSYTLTPLDGIKNGQTYTISDIGLAGVTETNYGEPVIWLEGIVRKDCRGLNCGFDPDRFKPLTNIDLFINMLNKVNNSISLERV